MITLLILLSFVQSTLVYATNNYTITQHPNLSYLYYTCFTNLNTQFKAYCVDYGTDEYEGPKALLVVKAKIKKDIFYWTSQHTLPLNECALTRKELRSKFSYHTQSFCITSDYYINTFISPLAETEHFAMFFILNNLNKKPIITYRTIPSS